MNNLKFGLENLFLFFLLFISSFSFGQGDWKIYTKEDIRKNYKFSINKAVSKKYKDKKVKIDTIRKSGEFSTKFIHSTESDYFFHFEIENYFESSSKSNSKSSNFSNRYGVVKSKRDWKESKIWQRDSVNRRADDDFEDFILSLDGFFPKFEKSGIENRENWKKDKVIKRGAKYYLQKIDYQIVGTIDTLGEKCYVIESVRKTFPYPESGDLKMVSTGNFLSKRKAKHYCVKKTGVTLYTKSIYEIALTITYDFLQEYREFEVSEIVLNSYNKNPINFKVSEDEPWKRNKAYSQTIEKLREEGPEKYLLKNPKIKKLFGPVSSARSLGKGSCSFWVKDENKISLLDQNGKTYVDNFDINYFKILNSNLLVFSENDKERGIKSIKSRKVLVPPSFRYAVEKQFGYFILQSRNPQKYGLIDSLGKVILPIEYGKLHWAKNELIIFSKMEGGSQTKVYFDTRSGKFVEEGFFLSKQINDNLKIVTDKDGEVFKLVDKENTQKFAMTFSSYEFLEKDQLRIEIGDEYQVLDLSKNIPQSIYSGKNIYREGSFYTTYGKLREILLDENFEKVHEHEMKVLDVGRVGCVIKDTLGDIYAISNNKSKLKLSEDDGYSCTDFFVITKGDRYFLYDSLMNETELFHKPDTIRGKSSYFIQSKNEKGESVIYSKNGVMTFEADVKLNKYTEDRIFIFKKNHLMGLIDESGKVILEPKFEYIQYEKGLYALFKKEGGRYCGLYCAKDNYLVPPIIDRFSVLKRGVFSIEDYVTREVVIFQYDY